MITTIYYYIPVSEGGTETIPIVPQYLASFTVLEKRNATDSDLGCHGYVSENFHNFIKSVIQSPGPMFPTKGLFLSHQVWSQSFPIQSVVIRIQA